MNTSIIADRSKRYKTTKIRAGKELSTIMITAQARPSTLKETGEKCLDICDERHAVAAKTITEINGKITADGEDYFKITFRGGEVPVTPTKCIFYLERICETTYEEDRGMRGLFCPADKDLSATIFLPNGKAPRLKRIDLAENGGLLTVANFDIPQNLG